MRVAASQAGSEFRFRLDLLPEEDLRGIGQFELELELVAPDFRVVLPSPIDPPHPDLLALVALSAARPWTRHRLVLDRGVSPAFAEEVHRVLGFELTPVDDQLASRKRPDGSVVSYSGGADSMASRALVEQAVPLHHLARIRHPRVPDRTTLTPAVSRRIAERVADEGAEMQFFETDLEFISARPFPTFPESEALLAGSVLTADRFDTGTIFFGRTINGVYVRVKTGHRRPVRELEWIELFAAAGLSLTYPVAGVLEVSTFRIVRERFTGTSRSCQSGSSSGPCLSCPKCARTELLWAALEERPIDRTILDRLNSSSTLVRAYERGRPYPSQLLLEYGLARVPGLEGSIFELALNDLAPTRDSTSWMERYYPTALRELANDFAEPLEKSLADADIPEMTAEDLARLETWSPFNGSFRR